jgi:hypothetical protein
MLQAPGGMRGLVLEVKVNLLQTWQLQLDQMGVGGTVKVGLDFPDGLADPFPLFYAERTINI